MGLKPTSDEKKQSGGEEEGGAPGRLHPCSRMDSIPVLGSEGAVLLEKGGHRPELPPRQVGDREDRTSEGRPPTGHRASASLWASLSAIWTWWGLAL